MGRDVFELYVLGKLSNFLVFALEVGQEENLQSILHNIKL